MGLKHATAVHRLLFIVYCAVYSLLEAVQMKVCKSSGLLLTTRAVQSGNGS